MRWSLKILIFFFTIFLLNILFYFVSSDYRFFLEHLKNPDVERENTFLLEEETDTPSNSQIVKLKDPQLGLSSQDEETISDTGSDKNTNFLPKKKILLGKNYKEILSRFTSEYVLKQIEINSSLFELTGEYPDYYYEYYSPSLTLYLFPSRSYKEIFDIFEYLSRSLPFSLNTVNNFGDGSFYINLREDIVDDFIRLVISENGITFGLKIKKDEYNRVKNLLE